MLKYVFKVLARIGWWLMVAFVYLAFRPRVRYINPDRKKHRFDKPVIFVGNHTSHMDGVLTTVIFRRNKACILVAKDWFDKPKFNWYLSNNRCIPMDRNGVETGWLRYSIEALKKKDESVILYPEGKTRKEDEPDEFKSGFILLAYMTGAPIVPFAVEGSYKMFFCKRQRILVGEPMELTAENKSMNPKYLEAESERFRQMVIQLQRKLKGEQKDDI